MSHLAFPAPEVSWIKICSWIDLLYSSLAKSTVSFTKRVEPAQCANRRHAGMRCLQYRMEI